MSTLGYNIVVLLLLFALVTGAGVYLTIFEQPKEIERLEQAEKLARLKQAEVTSLLAEEATSSSVAEEAIRKWRARYKVIPQQLNSADVMNYLNHRTMTGFKNFDVVMDGSRTTPDFSYFTINVQGKGYFSSLYRFIWEVENSRDFYRIRDLSLEHIDLMVEDEQTGNNKLQVMVSFSMKVDAYYGGKNGLSAPLGSDDALAEESLLPTSAGNLDLPPVPRGVLPKERPDINPFRPLILEVIPPNTYNLLDVEDAQLVSIVGGKAVFLWKDDFVTVGLGDPVYLGQITRIDVTEGIVSARLNKGGIVDEIEQTLDTGERFRQAFGPANLAPATTN